jgi:hypothetical protein
MGAQPYECFDNSESANSRNQSFNCSDLINQAWGLGLQTVTRAKAGANVPSASVEDDGSLFFAQSASDMGFAYRTDASADLPLSELNEVFQKNFHRLDAITKDGIISIEEINSAIMDHSFKGQDALLLAALKTGYDEFTDLHADIKYLNMHGGPVPIRANPEGIQREDMAVFDSQIAKPFRQQTSDIQDIDIAISPTLDSAKYNWKATSLDLYGGRPASESITPDAIRQGHIAGDCYLLAAISSAAAVSPEAIHSMIKDNGVDAKTGMHTYTVTFPGAPGNPVTVSAPTEAELSMTARGGYARVENTTGQELSYGTWPIILEKAAGRLFSEYPLEYRTYYASTVDADGTMGGSVVSAGLRLMTGGGVDTDINSLTTYATMHRKLSDAMSMQRPVTAYINGWEGLDAQEGALTAGHEYSVTAYDPERQVITIRNPFGSDSEGVPRKEPGIRRLSHGTFEMDLETFNKYFNGLTYAEKSLSRSGS